MRIEIIEKIKGEDLLKIESFLKKVDPSLKAFEESYKENPLEVFLEYPLPFHFSSPVYWDEWEGKDYLIFYEKGKAFIEIDENKEGLIFNFDWKTLYQEVIPKDNFFSQENIKKSIPKESIYNISDSKEISISKVKDGKDLISVLIHSTWLWLEEFSLSQADFILFLPFSFYPILKEPSTNSSWDNIQEELKRRLNIEVHLTHSFKDKALLVDKRSLSYVRTVNPCYFLGLDERGNRKLFFYLEMDNKKLSINSYSLNFSLSSLKGKNTTSSLKVFAIKSIIFFSLFFPLSWNLINWFWVYFKNLIN